MANIFSCKLREGSKILAHFLFMYMASLSKNVYPALTNTEWSQVFPTYEQYLRENESFSKTILVS